MVLVSSKPSALYKRISRAEYDRLFFIYRKRLDDVTLVWSHLSRRNYYALRSLYE